eukprot:IDg5095t1
MTETSTPEKAVIACCEELSPATVVASPLTSYTAPVSLPCLEEGDEQDGDPILIFEWIDDNADVFLQRWETRNEQVSEHNPSFNRPASLLDLYGLLLDEFAHDIDIDSANVVGKACIQCSSTIAYEHVTNRMGLFELRPWVTTLIGGNLPGSGKLSNLFVTTTVHKLKPVKLQETTKNIMSRRNQREVKGISENVEHWEETMVKQAEFYVSYLHE